MNSCLVCDEGKFQSLAGAVSASNCTNCPAGTFQPQKAKGGVSDCSPCLPGTYQPATGASSSAACVLCLAGLYSTGSGASSSANCTQCPAGTSQPSKGVGDSAACTRCAPGSYQPQPGWSGSCTICPKGTFLTGTGMVSFSQCQLCAGGTYLSVTGGSAPESCSACDAGKFQTGVGQIDPANCSACGVGTYQPSTGVSSAGGCILCNTGTFQTGTGMGSADRCQACSTGTYQPNTGASMCVRCAAGAYQDLPGLSTCNLCPTGRFQGQAGQSFCQICSAGTYQPNTGASLCVLCGAGTFQDLSGLSACNLCPTGRFQGQTGQSLCQPCAAGSANDQTGQSACTPCQAGKYTMLSGMQTCFACQAGQITASAGLSQCSPCAAGSVAGSSGMSKCDFCGTGQYQNEPGQGACMDCNGGTFQADTGKSTCIACGAGTVQPQTGASACVACLVGQFQALTGMQLCGACQGGQYQSVPGASFCSTCQAGFVQPLGGQSACIACQPGTWQPNPGNMLCAVCSPGQYQSLAGASICLKCMAGQYNSMVKASSSAACLSCNPGTFGFSAGYSACELCSTGKYASLPGSLQCATCDPGWYSNTVGSIECLACPTGKFGDTLGGQSDLVCQACRIGAFNDRTGRSACNACPAGSFVASTGLSSCAACLPGYVQEGTGSSTCVACIPGTYTPLGGRTACTACPPGTFQATPGASQCSACAPGTYGALTGVGAGGCTPCGQGTYSGAAGMQDPSTCQKCAGGKYSSITGSTSDASCQLCARGTFAAAGASVCTACPAGTVCVGGLSAPTACEAGLICDGSNMDAPAGFLPYLSPSGLCTGLLTCPFGTRCAMKNPQLGKGILEQRPSSGTAFVMYLGGLQSTASCNGLLYYDSVRVDFGQSAILFWDVLYWLEPAECGTGSFLLGNLCKKCPPGTFSTNPLAVSNNTCVPCPAGSISVVEGAQACSPCQVGRYIPWTGASVCVPCGPGSYQDVPGMSACALCAPGTFMLLTGASRCSVCAAGEFQAGAGATGCGLCGPSQFSSGGDPVCSECNQRLTPSPQGTACPVKTVPDDPTGGGAVWMTVQGFASDECLGIGQTSVIQGQASLEVFVNSSVAQCLHSLFASGMRGPIGQWVNTVSNLRRPTVLRVHAFNQTTSPGVCKRHGFGVAFTVRDSTGSMFTDLTGASADILVLDQAQKQILYMQPCERIPMTTDPVPYGTCTIPGDLFCPVVGVTVQVTYRAPDLNPLMDSVDIQAGGGGRPCAATGANLILLQLLDSDGPFLPADTMRVQLVLSNPSPQYGAFRLTVRLTSATTFLSFQSALAAVQQYRDGTLTISATIPDKSSLSILGEIRLQLTNASNGLMTILCPLAASSTLTLTSGWSVDAQPLGLGFSCRTDGCLDALGDAGGVTALIATPSRGMLIHWRALSSGSLAVSASIRAISLGKVPGTVTPAVSAVCTSSSDYLAVGSCYNVTARGQGQGDENAMVRVTYLGASTSVFLAVFVPQNLVVWSSGSGTGVTGRYKLFTNLKAGDTIVSNVDATPFVGSEFLRLNSNMMGNESVLTPTFVAPVVAVNNEQWTCAVGQTGVIKLFQQPLGTCEPAKVFETLDVILFTGGQTSVGKIVMNPSYLATGQTTGVLLPFSGKTLVAAESAISASSTALAFQGVNARMVLSGSSGQCVAIQFTVRNITYAGVIPVYPPGPSRLDVQLGTKQLVSSSDPTRLMPSSTTVGNVMLVFADGSLLDVTQDPRLSLQGFGLVVSGRVVSAQAAGDWAVQARLQGIPCVALNTSVNVVASAISSSRLTCTGCPQLTSPDDPLSVQYPTWFPSMIPISMFAVVHTLIDGRRVSVNETLIVTGSARLDGLSVKAVSSGAFYVRTASTSALELNVYGRWAVNATLRCNWGPCTKLLLAPLGDTATMAPFYYQSSLVVSLQLGLINGTVMSAGLLDGVSLTYNGLPLKFDRVPLVYGPLILSYAFSDSWQLPSGSASLNVARFQALSILGPDQIFQVHCSGLWQEVRYSARILLSDGNASNITTNLSCTLPLVTHAPGLFHADWAGEGLILVNFGKEIGSKTVQAVPDSVLFAQIRLDSIPDVWQAYIGASFSLFSTLSPVFASQPWYNTSNLTKNVVQWSSYPTDVVQFGNDLAVLTRDCYAPLTISASLKACDSFPMTNFSKIVSLNVQPTTLGQVDLGSANGLALSAVPVGGQIAIDLAILAPESLQVC